MLTLENLRTEQDGFRLSADLSVGAARITAVIGPSGGGKSTLLNAIAGFVPLTAGRVLWDGRDIGALPPGERPLSILFQDNNLFAHLDVAQNVGLGLRPSLRLSAAQQARLDEALSQVGMAGFAGRKPGVLSGGQQSRVALARVLVRARPLLLLDEPFAALGPALRAEMLDLVAALARSSDTRVLMVTHDPADARRIAGETMFVEAGIVHPPVATEALFSAPPEGLRDYLG